MGRMLITGSSGGPGAALEPAATVAVQELALKPGGGAWEIEPDSQGRVWISEFTLGEIWQVGANGLDVQAYEVGGSPSDAHPDGAGWVWWLDDVALHRLNPANKKVETWSVPSAIWMWGLAFDSQGRIWINDSGSGSVLRFDPAGQQLVRFPLPNSGNGYYVATAGTQAWVGDAINGRLLRLDADLNQMEWWQLPIDSAPNDLAVDSSNNVWYTDSTLYQIGRLNPNTNELTIYALPEGTTANMLTLARGKVWYSASTTEVSSYGSLDPQAASGSTEAVTKNQETIEFTPVTVEPQPEMTVKTRQEAAGWSAGTVSGLGGGAGWAAFDLPAGASPWGIAVTNSGWLVDKGRQVLVRFAIANPGNFRVYVPAIAR